MKYKLNAAILNRTKTPKKISDGHRLFWQRNADLSLTAWQRVSIAGKDKDIRVDAFVGEITAAQVESVRKRGWAMKTGNPADEGESAMTVAELWGKLLAHLQTAKNGRWSEHTTKKNTERVNNHIKPTMLWGMQVRKIRTQDIVDALAPLKATMPATEEKVRIILNKLFQYALIMRWTSENPVPAVASLYAAVYKPEPATHFAAYTDLPALQEVLRLNAESVADQAVRFAARFQALTAQRTGNVVSARWADIDLEAGSWVIPRADMKIKAGNRPDHTVPLSSQAVALLSSIEKRGPFVFTSNRSSSGHITANSLPKHYRDTLNLGAAMVPHGWRSAFKTLARDAIGEDGRPLFAESWLKAAMDHADTSRTDQAYVRKQATDGARLALQWWADQLEVSDDN